VDTVACGAPVVDDDSLGDAVPLDEGEGDDGVPGTPWMDLRLREAPCS
jgi:hypothetical protein